MKKPKTASDADFYASILNQFPNPVFIKDTRFRYTLVNKAFCSFFKVRSEAVNDHVDKDFLAPGVARAMGELQRKVLRTHSSAHTQCTVTTSNGTAHVIDIMNSVFASPSGEKHLFGMVTDITDRTQAINKLKESEKKYKAIFQLTPNPVGIFSFPDRIALDVNTAFIRLSKVSRKNIIGKQGILAYKWVSQEERERYMATIARDKMVNNLEVRLQLQDGRTGTYLLSARMVMLEEKPAVIATFRDISQNKKMEHELISRVLKTEERERQRFAGDLHDDLGPMLSTIKLQMEFIKSLKDQKSISEYTDLNIALLNDVITRLHSISMNIAPHLIEHYGLEAAVRDLVSRVTEAAGASIHFTSKLASRRFPRETELHLYRIISELLNNSLKHAAGFPIFLRLQETPAGLQMRFHNKGKPYSIARALKEPSCLGLQNVMRRVSHLSGTIDFQNRKGYTVVNVKVPATPQNPRAKVKKS